VGTASKDWALASTEKEVPSRRGGDGAVRWGREKAVNAGKGR
jgi:hypothetical protein